jgi:hypothetical protein
MDLGGDIEEVPLNDTPGSQAPRLRGSSPRRLPRAPAGPVDATPAAMPGNYNPLNTSAAQDAIPAAARTSGPATSVSILASATHRDNDGNVVTTALVQLGDDQPALRERWSTARRLRQLGFGPCFSSCFSSLAYLGVVFWLFALAMWFGCYYPVHAYNRNLVPGTCAMDEPQPLYLVDGSSCSSAWATWTGGLPAICATAGPLANRIDVNCFSNPADVAADVTLLGQSNYTACFVNQWACVLVSAPRGETECLGLSIAWTCLPIVLFLLFLTWDALAWLRTWCKERRER